MTHRATGLRFFVWENIDPRQTEFVVLGHFADQAVLGEQARAVGLLRYADLMALAPRAGTSATMLQYSWPTHQRTCNVQLGF